MGRRRRRRYCPHENTQKAFNTEFCNKQEA
jgi:hypothetical protein